MNSHNRKKVLCPIERKDGKTYWLKVGAAFVNRDGSWNVHLDALPATGKLQIRDLDERDLRRSDERKAERDRQGAPGSSDSNGQGIIPF